jgi:Flp pilus assembly protein TadG
MVTRGKRPRPVRRDLAPRDLVRDESGASAIVIGLCMTGLMGFAGMAVDVGVWYADKRAAQGAADSAAYSAGTDLFTGDTASGATANAKAVTAQYGYTDGAGGVTVTVNTPPTSGSHTTTAGAVEVIVTKSESLFFSSFFRSAASIGARAVAVAGSSGGGACVLATNTGNSTSISTADVAIGGSATIDTSNCGVYANASGSDSLDITGNATLLAKDLSVVGNYSVSSGGTLTVTGTKTTGAPVMADPYANVATPSPGACAGTNSWNNDATISPGTYCNGFSVNSSANISLQPGVYIINGGSFSVNGSASISGTGVTIVLTGSAGNYATATINGGAGVNLSAPTSGATSGIVFLQDRNDTSGQTSKINGGSGTAITGALYFPSQTLKFSGGSSSASTCTQVIADQISYLGSAYFNNKCTGDGVTPIGQSNTTLVE